MSNKHTIIGEAPSGEPTWPPDLVPGDDSSEAGASMSRADLEPRLDWSTTGDATTAFHHSRLYSLLSLGFERPDPEFQRALEAGAFSSDLVESAAVVTEDAIAIAESVARLVDDAEELHDEWVSLFGVEEGRTVSPYELTYLPGPLMTNIRKLADLSGFYEAFGLEVNPRWNDRRDHLCYLLEFLATLSIREAYLRVEGDDRGVAIVCDARCQFLEDHLGRWYWRFTDEVSQRTDGFYAVLADLLAAVVEDEIGRFELEPAWVPDDPEVTEWTEDIFGDSGRDCGGCGVTPQSVDGGPESQWTPSRSEENANRES